jgi:hypothetical protein
VTVVPRTTEGRVRLPHAENLLLAFWLFQTFAWTFMLVWCLTPLGSHLAGEVRYVTLISHWALIETAAVAAVTYFELSRERHARRHPPSSGDSVGSSE